MTNSQWATIFISAIVGVSGWAKFLYDHITSHPKIKGQIFSPIVGHTNKLVPGNELTTFLVYLYITNFRKNPVHILDYEMEVLIGGRFKKINRVYGLDNVQNWNFLHENGQEIIIPDFQQKLIYNKTTFAEYGTPLHGFILFAGDDSYYKLPKKKYRITCIDAFGKKHRFTVKSNGVGNFFLLQDIAGIRFPMQTLVNR